VRLALDFLSVLWHCLWRSTRGRLPVFGVACVAVAGTQHAPFAVIWQSVHLAGCRAAVCVLNISNFSMYHSLFCNAGCAGPFWSPAFFHWGGDGGEVCDEGRE
jgi:hypothetical protein